MRADALIKCAFCGTYATLENAVDLGWTPSFWVGDVEVCRPVCEECAAANLDDLDGDPVLMAGKSLPTK